MAAVEEEGRVRAKIERWTDRLTRGENRKEIEHERKRTVRCTPISLIPVPSTFLCFSTTTFNRNLTQRMTAMNKVAAGREEMLV